MIYIGSHVSRSKGYLAMGKHTKELGGTTFAFFMRNPRGGVAAALKKEDICGLERFLREERFGPLVAHASYTMNLCAAKPDIREKSFQMLTEDLERLEYLPGNYYNLHPGSHVGQGVEPAVTLIADALNRAIKPDQTSTVLLETMAGKGTEMGRSFEEIKAIIDKIEQKEKIGVCFDTCHTWDGGYDLENFEQVIAEFDAVIGSEYLKAFHLNDSLNNRNSHKDRHARLEEGKIGDSLKQIVQHPIAQEKPFILETPNDEEGYKREIRLIKSWVVL